MQNLASSPRQVIATILYIVLLVAWLQISASSANAFGINKQINFQGKVVNADGTNVTDGEYSFTFSLYADPSGGSAIWTETKNLTVTSGIFRTALGDSTALPGSVNFNTDNIYLGVNFNSDGEMAPRMRFTAVPYAFNAEKVNGLTVTTLFDVPFESTTILKIGDGKTVQFGNSVTINGTDSTTFTLPTANDTLVGLTAIQTLTNKTLTSPTLTTPRFADGGFIADASGNELLIFDSNASAVNEITLANAATGNGVSLAATGGDTNVAFSITSKAAGALTLDSGTTGTVNLGTSNNAKTLNLGTGTAGNTINIGTNNTTSDTINIGSLLDNVAITGDAWSITDAGALTVASCTGCAAAGAIDGSGNANFIPKFSDSNTIGDSLLSDASNILTYSGTGGLDLSGSGANLTLSNDETIDNDTNGQIRLNGAAPTASATIASVLIGPTALSGANSNGTYLGINAPSGAQTDFFNFQENGTTEWHMDSWALYWGAGDCNSVLCMYHQALQQPAASNGGVYGYAGNTWYFYDLSFNQRITIDTATAGTDWLMAAGGDITVNASTTANTTTSGVIDLNVNSVTANNVGFNLDYIMNDGVSAANDLFGGKINLTANDADGDMFGLQIQSQASTNAGAGSFECLLCLDNAENTAGAVTDGIRIASSGVAAGITNDIKLQNNETISNTTDGTIALGGSVSVSGISITATSATTVDFSNAALTVSSCTGCGGGGGIDGSGTANSIPKFTDADTIGDSLLSDASNTLTYSGTSGLSLSGTGADITFALGESINNDTDGTIGIVGALDVSGHAAFGNNASVNSSVNIMIGEALTDTASNLYRGIYSVLTLNPAGDSTASIRSMESAATWAGSVNHTGSLVGTISEVFLSSGSSGTVANAYAYQAYPVYASSSTTAVTTAYGMYINNSTLDGASLSNQYGIRVIDMTSGTNDYGIRIDGADTQALWIGAGANNTDAENGLAFGSSRDTNLYRSAADTLFTDDSFTADINLTVNGNTTLGNLNTADTFTGSLLTSAITSGASTQTAFSLAAASLTTGTGLNITGTINDTAASTRALAQVTLTASPGSSSNSGFVGFAGNVTTAAGSNIANNITGLQGQATNTSTSGSVLIARGVVGTIVSSGAGGTITNAYALAATNANVVAGTITHNYGLMVSDQTAGTNDYGIAIAGADTRALWVGSGADNTDAANGITFGLSADTNLYRSDANTLKTDDSFALTDNAWLGLSSSTGRIEFDDQATDEVNILNANVGIGTDTPDVKLDITESQNAATEAYVQNPDTGTSAVAGLAALSDSAGIAVRAYSGSFSNALLADSGVIFTTSTASNGLTFATDASAPIKFYTAGVSSGTERMSISSAGVVVLGTTTNGLTFTPSSGGPVYTGTARPSKTVTFSPEYAGAVLTTFYGAGTDTDTTGAMTATGDTTPGTSIRNYYQWERTTDATQHFYTVAVRITLPSDFAAWQTTNAVQVAYITESATTTLSDVDVRIYNDNSATIVASDLDNSSTSWTTADFDDSVLDDGAGSEWDAAGETAVIYLRMGSASSNYVRVGDITLNYLSRF